MVIQTRILRKGGQGVKKRIIQGLFALVMVCLLAGCTQSGEDLYALPQLPEDYLALQTAIDKVKDELGAEFAAPAAGSNVQSIQLHDLDSDEKGERESAVVFFRVPNGAKPLKMCIFRPNAMGEYQMTWIIEGDGTAIYSVAFENLGGDKAKELVVSWQISTKVHSLAAYSLQKNGDVVELMRSGYTRQAIIDLDRDNEREIVLIQLDTAENNSRAELYKYNSGLMVHTSTAPLSLNLTEIESAKSGTLIDMIPALFVSSSIGALDGRVTDVIALRDGVLTNLTMDPTTEMSITARRSIGEFQDINGADINGDGVLELPIPEMLPPVSGEVTGSAAASASLPLLHWYQFHLDGTVRRVCTTFHTYEDGWYLITPENKGWEGQITVARRENIGTSVTERAVSFYYWPDWDSGIQPKEFLTVYRLSGANRALRATMDGRFKLVETNDVIYAAKLRTEAWDCGLDKDEVLELFNRIKISWSAEN